MIKVGYDKNLGDILGYYPDSIIYPEGAIPDSYIEITEDEHIMLINANKYWIVDTETKKIVEGIPRQPIIPPKPFEGLKEERILAVNDGFEASFLNGLKTSLRDEKGNFIVIHCKKEDQNNYSGWLAVVSMDIKTSMDTILPIPLIDFNGGIHMITKAQLGQLGMDVLMFKARQEQRRAEILGEIVKITEDTPENRFTLENLHF